MFGDNTTRKIMNENILMLDDYVLLKPRNAVESHCHKMPHIISRLLSTKASEKSEVFLRAIINSKD